MSFTTKEVPVKDRRINAFFCDTGASGTQHVAGITRKGAKSQQIGMIWNTVGRFGEKWGVIAFDEYGSPVSPGRAPTSQEEASKWLSEYHTDQRQVRLERKRAAARAAKAQGVK